MAAGRPGPDWMPPPPAWPDEPGDGGPEEESRRPAWIAALVVVAVVLAGGATWLLTRGPGPAAPAAEAPTSTAPDDDAVASTPAPGDPAPDDELDAAAVDAHRELFLLIDESERAMIDFILGLPDTTEPLDGTQREEVGALGEDAASQLRDLRGRIEDTDAPGRSSPGVTAVREAYLAHLGDWIDWTAAVADDPGLVTGDGARPHDEAINDSAAAFVAAVEDALGDRSRLPDDLADLVDLVIERGFSSGDGNELGEI